MVVRNLFKYVCEDSEVDSCKTMAITILLICAVDSHFQLVQK